MSTEMSVTLPSWMVEKLSAIAEICGESIDYVAASFFAAEVVHTSTASGASLCP